MVFSSLFVAAAAVLVAAVAAAPGPVLVTGATGGLGSDLYKLLQAQRGVGNVRAMVTNHTKAKEVLGCTKCDASEGIFIGDVTDAASMVPAFSGVTQLMIAVGTAGTTDTKVMNDVEFLGVMNQVAALTNTTTNPANSGGLANMKVVLCSSMGTTDPAPHGSSRVLFYKLQAETFLGSAGITTSVVKPCGLMVQPNVHLTVGHNDELLDARDIVIARSDVARVMVAALDRTSTDNLRFDLCAGPGPATTDAELPALLTAARWAWAK